MPKSIKIFYFLILLCISGKGFAQFPKMASIISGDSVSLIKLFEVDNQGNYFITGQMKDTAYVDTVPNASSRMIANSRDEDFFFAKLDTAGKFLWGAAIGGLEWDHVEAMEVDNFGNVYLAGQFEDTVDFDITSGVLQKAGDTLGRDIFLAKYSSSGIVQWVNQLGRPNSSEEIYDLVIDYDGNILITGSLYDSLDVDPSSGIYTVYSRNFQDILLAKYNSAGNIIWATNMGGTGLDEGHTLSVDLQNNIFIAGEFEDTIIMDSANTYTHTATPVGNFDYVIGKYNKDGQYLWSKKFGNQHIEEITNSLVDDQGNLYIEGNFQGTMDFDLSSSIANKTALTGNSFLAKYDGQGNYKWATVLNGDWTLSYGMEFDLFGNIVMGGFHYGDMYLDPSSSAKSDSTTSVSAFAVIYDPKGKYLDHFSIHNNGFSAAWDAKMNTKGQVVMAGIFSGEFPIDSTTVFNNQTGGDAFIAAYDLGCYTYHDTAHVAICFGDSILIDGLYRTTNGIYTDTLLSLNSCYNVTSYNLTIDSIYQLSNSASICFGDSMLIAGEYRQTAGTYVDTLSSNKGCDSVVSTSLSIRNVFTKNIIEEICNGESYHIGNQVYSTSGNYSVHLSSQFGCDSIVNLELSVKLTDLNYVLSSNGKSIEVTLAGDSIEWYDCDKKQLILGASGKVFNAASNGNYAFIKYNDNCTDTSNCIEITSVGINRSSIPEGVIVYPNPSNDFFNIDPSYLTGNTLVELYDLLGNKVFSDENIDRIDVSTLPNGNYVLRIRDDVGEIKMVLHKK